MNGRVVAFPEAGDGVELKFTNRGFKALRAALGPDAISAVTSGLIRGDVAIIDLVLKIAAQRDGEQANINLDDLDHVPLDTVQTRCLDALSRAVNGRTFAEHQAFLEASQAA